MEESVANWQANVPPKVRIFIWKLVKDVLPTKKNKHIRRIEKDDQCDLCGNVTEDSFHATIECTHARNLRWAMRDHWPLPDDQLITRTGPQWLLLLLDRCTAEQGDLLMLVLWRAWTVHNDITHNLGSNSITNSVHFLLNYREVLLQVRQNRQTVDGKGKAACWPSASAPRLRSESPSKWEPPPEGWLKLNVDGSFVAQRELAW